MGLSNISEISKIVKLYETGCTSNRRLLVMNPIWIGWLPRSISKRLEGRPVLLKALGNTGWLFVDKAVRMGIGLFVSVWVARYLGPQQFGLFSYALALVALFGTVAGLGLDGIVVRDLVRSPQSRESLLGTAFILKLIAGFATFVVTIGATTLLRPGDAQTLWLVGIIAAGTIVQAFDVIDFWFQSIVESRYVVYAKNTAFLLASCAKVVMIIAEAPLVAFAWAALVEITLGAIGLIIAYSRHGRSIVAWRPAVSKALVLLRESWSLVLASVAVTIYMKIDQVMLGDMLGDEAVGVYSAAARISEIWYFIPVAIVSSATPALVDARKVSGRMYYRHLTKLFGLMVGIALIVAIPMSFFADAITNFVYGTSYSGAGPILALHIWAAVFVFLGVAQGPWTINEGLMKLALFRTMGGAIANVLLNILLIPPLGGIGAATATVVSYALSAVVFNVLSKQTRRIFVMQLNAMSLIGIVKK